ncbi:MAG: endonuclease/exonuclease/phosphatase family protein [Pseudomonadota bacterium]
MSQAFRLVAWNIRAGGGVRVDAIADALLDWRGDAIVLSEFRATQASSTLAQALSAQGYPFQIDTTHQVKHGGNALLIAAREPIRKVGLRRYPTEPGRWCAVRLQKTRLVICGLHVPNQHTGRKPKFHDEVLALMQRWRGGPAIIAGDTNSGRIGEDEETSIFNQRTTSWFDEIHNAGWADAFRLKYGMRREFTWYSPGHDNGFRLDQAFVSPRLTDCVADCQHIWAGGRDDTRRDRVSDHAAVIVDICLP